MVSKITYKLENIPVWDALEKDSECFLCDLAKEAEKDGLKFYLGSSVMNPETRVRVNEYGFCPRHFTLLEKGNPQGLALMCDTYLEQSRNGMQTAFDHLLRSKPGRKTSQSIAEISRIVAQREKGCLVCNTIEERSNRYLYTVAALWVQDQNFRDALKKSKGFCLYHFTQLLEMADKALNSSDCHAFVKEMTELEMNNLERIQKDVYWMTQKYKSENSDKDWNGCEDAQKRSVLKLVGSCRPLDPIKVK